MALFFTEFLARVPAPEILSSQCLLKSAEQLAGNIITLLSLSLYDFPG
jgi:hypothetical protein